MKICFFNIILSGDLMAKILNLGWFLLTELVDSYFFYIFIIKSCSTKILVLRVVLLSCRVWAFGGSQLWPAHRFEYEIVRFFVLIVFII